MSVKNAQRMDFRVPVNLIQNMNTSNEFKIPISGRNTIVHLSRGQLLHDVEITAYTVVDGKETVATEIDVSNVEVVKAGILNLYEEIKYVIENTTVDLIRKPGISTVIKGLCTFANDTAYCTAGWNIKNEKNKLLKKDGKLKFVVDLKTLMGCFEGNPEPIRHMDQEFRLIRGSSDSNNCLVAKDTKYLYKINVKDVYINAPVITLHDEYNAELCKQIAQGKEYIVKFYHWNYTSTKMPAGEIKFMYDMPSIYPPEFILTAHQTKREGDLKKDISKFDNLGLLNRQFTPGNNEQYPSQWQGEPVKMYIAYLDHICEWNEKHTVVPLLTFDEFWENYSISAINCSYYNQKLLKSTINPRIDSTFSKPIPEGSIMHIVSLTPSEYRYMPYTKTVITGM